MPAKIISIFGATGNQGRSVIRAILLHTQLSQEWTVRGVTRNPNKPDAQAMIAQGIQMVRADLNNKDSLRDAIRGSHAVFGVTNYWEEGSLEHEVMQGQNLADACKEEEIEHLIWSSLPYASKITGGRLHSLHHFDAKAIVAEYITALGLPASFVLPAYFMSNIPSAVKPDHANGGYGLAWLFRADQEIPMLDVPNDFGKFVASCLANPAATMGKYTLATSGWFTPIDIVRSIEECTGTRTLFYEIPLERYQGSKELFDNLIMIREFDYYGPGSREAVKRSHQIVEGVGGWPDFGDFGGYLHSIGFKSVVVTP